MQLESLDRRCSHSLEQVRKTDIDLSYFLLLLLLLPPSYSHRAVHCTTTTCSFVQVDVSSLHQRRLECESALVHPLSALFFCLFVNMPPLIIASLLAVWQHLQWRFSRTKLSHPFFISIWALLSQHLLIRLF